MHEIHELKNRLCDELDEYGSKGKLDVGDLDVVDKLAHTIKNLDKIIESYDEQYSGAGRMYDSSYDGSYDGSYRGSYDRGRSYARGRGSNARRDPMGRYSSRGYAMDSASMVMELRELMKDAPDERTKQEFQRFIQKVEQM
jgi:hypothetical protein